MFKENNYIKDIKDILHIHRFLIFARAAFLYLSGE